MSNSDSSAEEVGYYPRPDPAPIADHKGIWAFFAVLAGLTLLRIAMRVFPFPLPWIPILSIVVTIIFVALPIFALFRAGDSSWSRKTALIFLVGGLIGHLGLIAASRITPVTIGLLCKDVAQMGLICWCIGLGALLVTSLKDRNLIVPVTIFLAFFDLFLVFTPVGFTKQIMQAQPELLPAVGYNIPGVMPEPRAPGAPTAPVKPYAYVGLADFIFMAMFFIALYRFGLRPKQTLIALIPTLLLYLILSAYFGAIPLLPPIALVVLIVNMREFKMNSEEKMSTAVVAILCAALVTWAALRPKPPPELEQKAPVQGHRTPAG